MKLRPTLGDTMKREVFIRDIENMETIMCHTANSDSNGWQYVYWLSVAVWHVLLKLIKDK